MDVRLMDCKKLILLVLAVALAGLVAYELVDSDDSSAATTSGSTGNCTWSVNEDGTELTITAAEGKDGKMANYRSSGTNYLPPWKNYKSTLTTVIIEEGVTYIGNYSFYNNTGLKSVTIPDSVTTIGESAFQNCRALEKVEIPSGTIGKNAFSGCNSLTDLTLGGNVTSIGESAFSLLHAEKLVIPNSVTSIGKQAFYNGKFTTLTLGTGVSVIGEKAFYHVPIKSLSLPSNLGSIGASAFSGINITALTIPKNVTYIGNSAFSSCTDLKEVAFELGSKLMTMGNSVFSDCTKLTCSKEEGYFGKIYTPLTIPNTVTSFGTGMFKNCSSLMSVTLGKGITTIPDDTFNGCVSLGMSFQAQRTIEVALVTILGDIESIGNNAFMHCSALRTLDLSGTLKSVGNYAFYDCSGLTMAIPNTLTSIGTYAFHNCTSIRTVGFSEDLVSINANAFEGSGITSAVLPDGVTTIGLEAFKDCVYLTSITFGSGLTSIGTRAFENTGLVSVSIPDNVENINTVFSGSSLETITLGKNVNSYQGNANNQYFQINLLPSLVSISVDEDNPYLKSVDGVLFSKDMSKLICYPTAKADKEYAIPNGVTSIPDIYVSNLESLTIPDTVVSVKLQSCPQLKTLSLGSGVASFSIVRSVATSLSVLSVSSANETYKAVDNVLFSNGGTTLQLYPATKTDEVYTVPEGVTTIAGSAFQYNPYLKTLVLGKDVSSITGSQYLFEECTSFTGFKVIEGNKNLSVDENGVLFNFDKTTLILYPAALILESYIIPETVTSIASWAFYNSTVPDELTFSKTLTSLSGNPFNTSHPTASSYVRFVDADGKVLLVSANNMAGFSFKRTDGNMVRDSYLLSFNANKGTGTMAPIQVKSGDAVSPECTFKAPANKHFAYWATTSSGTAVELPYAVSSSITLYAIWEYDAYTVHISGSDIMVKRGNIDVNDGDKVPFGTTLTVTMTEKPGQKGNITATAGETVTKLAATSYQMTASDVTFTGEYTEVAQYEYTVYYKSSNKDIQEHFTGKANLGTRVKVIAPEIEGYKISSTTGYITITETVSKNICTFNYTVVNYTVTYLDEAGVQTGTTESHQYGSTVNVRTFPGKIGYTFAWESSDVTVTDGQFKMPAKNVVLTATYTINQFGITVSYEDKDGNKILGDVTIQADYGSTVTLGVPEVNGYKSISEPKTVTVNLENEPIVYVYEKNETAPTSVTVSYMVDGVITSQEQAVPGASITLSKYVKVGYDVTEWSSADVEIVDGKFTVPTKNVLLTATSKPLQYEIEIIYQDTEGNVLGRTVLKADCGSTVTPGIPSIEGYTSPSETKTVTVASENAPIVYTYTVKLYSVTISGEGLTVRNGNSDVSGPVPYGTVLTVSLADKIGYTGIVTASSGVLGIDGTYVVSGDVVLTGTYTVNEYTIIFNSNGGNAISSITGGYGSAIVAPADPVREGYRFLGWTPELPSTIPAENLTVTALWAQSPTPDSDGNMTVTFVPSTGTKTVDVSLGTNTSVKVDDGTDLVGKVVTTSIVPITNTSGLDGDAYEFSFVVDGGHYNGSFEVTLPCVKEDGKLPAVYFADGSIIEKMDVVSTTDSSVTFQTDHNSTYVVVMEDEDTSDDDTNVLLAVVTIFAVVLVLLLVVFAYRTRKA